MGVDGRSFSRSALPVGLLMVCMASVLYWNASYYAGRKVYGSSRNDRPAQDVATQPAPTEEVRLEERPGEDASRTPKVPDKAVVVPPSKDDLPEPPAVEAADADVQVRNEIREWSEGEGAGGMGGQWDDDAKGAVSQTIGDGTAANALGASGSVVPEGGDEPDEETDASGLCADAPAEGASSENLREAPSAGGVVGGGVEGGVAMNGEAQLAGSGVGHVQPALRADDAKEGSDVHVGHETAGTGGMPGDADSGNGAGAASIDGVVRAGGAASGSAHVDEGVGGADEGDGAALAGGEEAIEASAGISASRSDVEIADASERDELAEAGGASRAQGASAGSGEDRGDRGETIANKGEPMAPADPDQQMAVKRVEAADGTRGTEGIPSLIADGEGGHDAGQAEETAIADREEGGDENKDMVKRGGAEAVPAVSVVATVDEGAAVGVGADENDIEDGGTPDLPPNGAVQGEMECKRTRQGQGAQDIVNIATWKQVPGDGQYLSPLRRGLDANNTAQYVTLEKDLGGFNNIRLSLECAVAFAAATGRTLVIPPPFPVWNMKNSAGRQEVDVRTLFSFDKLRESGRVRVITTEEFLEAEGLTGNLGVMPGEAAKRLDFNAVREYMVKVAGQYPKGLPEMNIPKAAFVMPRRMDEKVDLQAEPYQFAKKWLYSRQLVEYLEGWQDAKVIHWRSKSARLLAPFYAFVLHADKVADRYYRRLMRDFMHYPEEVYCKASQIITLIRQEDPSGSFSSFHVRRNDFMKAYKAVDIDVPTILANSVDHLEDNEVVYVATDETNTAIFAPFAERFRVRFLSDYYELAGVSELSPNYLGMLEQIIASHGRTFTGCWFSTFTAYILRLRGHLQKPRKSNWSYYIPRKDYHHEYQMPENPLWATEWPLGWEDLDATGAPDDMAL